MLASCSSLRQFSSLQVGVSATKSLPSKHKNHKSQLSPDDTSFSMRSDLSGSGLSETDRSIWPRTCPQISRMCRRLTNIVVTTQMPGYVCCSGLSISSPMTGAGCIFFNIVFQPPTQTFFFLCFLSHTSVSRPHLPLADFCQCDVTARAASRCVD